MTKGWPLPHHGVCDAALPDGPRASRSRRALLSQKSPAGRRCPEPGLILTDAADGADGIFDSSMHPHDVVSSSAFATEVISMPNARRNICARRRAASARTFTPADTITLSSGPSVIALRLLFVGQRAPRRASVGSPNSLKHLSEAAPTLGAVELRRARRRHARIGRDRRRCLPEGAAFASAPSAPSVVAMEIGPTGIGVTVVLADGVLSCSPSGSVSDG